MLPFFAAALLFFTVRTLVCAPASPRVALGGETMGTTWSVVLNAPGLGREDRSRAQSAAQRALDAVDAAMSTWQPDSEVSRFNAHHSAEPFVFSAATIEVLELAERVSRASGGAFDVTVRPLVAAWGFGAGARLPGDGPDAGELAALAGRTGYEKLVIDAAASTARKLHPELEIDLSALAKGYGVDRAAEALEALGHRHYLVEVGGEVRARGVRPDGEPWRLAIEHPTADGRAIYGVIRLQDGAMATSGDYRSFYETAAGRITHIIDPRSRRTVPSDVASVSVVHPSAAVADAWATAFTVLGPDAGEEIARQQRIAVHWLLRASDGTLGPRVGGDFPEVELRGAR